jgi:hypothetical protein
MRKWTLASRRHERAALLATKGQLVSFPSRFTGKYVWWTMRGPQRLGAWMAITQMSNRIWPAHRRRTRCKQPRRPNTIRPYRLATPSTLKHDGVGVWPVGQSPAVGECGVFDPSLIPAKLWPTNGAKATVHRSSPPMFVFAEQEIGSGPAWCGRADLSTRSCRLSMSPCVFLLSRS